MKKGLLLIVAFLSSVSMAQNVATNSLTSTTVKELPVIRNQLGTGTPSVMDTIGLENAAYVDDGYYHVPQYMPNFPTAATIWPRVVEVGCKKASIGVVCDGYHWSPKLGRGEYLFLLPKVKEESIIPEIAPPPPPQIVYIEVPVKKKGE
jgi:hypothetical protein